MHVFMWVQYDSISVQWHQAPKWSNCSRGPYKLARVAERSLELGFRTLDWAQLLHLHTVITMLRLLWSESTGFRQSPNTSNLCFNLMVLILLLVRTISYSDTLSTASALRWILWSKDLVVTSCDLQVVPASRGYQSAGNWLWGWPFGIQPAVSWHGCSDCLFECTTR